LGESPNTFCFPIHPLLRGKIRESQTEENTTNQPWQLAFSRHLIEKEKVFIFAEQMLTQYIIKREKSFYGCVSS
jgi:hypothetical protein